MGGSAGGLTALLVCAHHGDLVRAGVSAYGVTDLFDLAETTHRFESRYFDEIVGSLPTDSDTLPGPFAGQRMPRASACRCSCFQGDEDEVVPRAQADALVAAVREAGGTVEYHVYEGEGHGWSRAATTAGRVGAHARRSSNGGCSAR